MLLTFVASDLVKGGSAPRVVIFVPPAERADLELARRGLADESADARAPRLLRVLAPGFPVRIDVRSAPGTTEQARLLRRYCDESLVRSVTVVASADHSRRLHRELERRFKGSGTEVNIHVTPYANFDPEAWWQTRSGLRPWIVEIQELTLEVILHPLG